MWLIDEPVNIRAWIKIEMIMLEEQLEDSNF